MNVNHDLSYGDSGCEDTLDTVGVMVGMIFAIVAPYCVLGFALEAVIPFVSRYISGEINPPVSLIVVLAIVGVVVLYLASFIGAQLLAPLGPLLVKITRVVDPDRRVAKRTFKYGCIVAAIVSVIALLLRGYNIVVPTFELSFDQAVLFGLVPPVLGGFVGIAIAVAFNRLRPRPQ